MLGITGSMGSGKSTVTKIFEDFGCHRISSDEIARNFTSENSTVKSELIEILGTEILDEKGVIDRKKIASIVFINKSAITKLNELLHPLIRQKTISIIESINDGKVIVWEAPLLFEAGGDKLCDAVLTVYADYSDSWKRVRQRDDITEEEFQSRLANQMDIKKKIEASDFKIVNDKDLLHLKSESRIIYNEILNGKLS